MKAAAALGLAVLVAVGSSLRAASPVGHWRSAQGQDAYLASYRAAFAELPRPAATLDLRTSSGVVRVYRFATTRSASAPAVAPLVLLPGTRSATPVWADNMDDLLVIADVYSVELLGEPGMSVQERPITSAADEARWLHEVLAQLPEKSLNLVGLSIGGWTAVNLALHHPEKVNSLTLIDPINVFGAIPWGTALRSLPAAASWLPKSWRDGFNSFTANGAPVEDVPVADMIELGMRHYALKKPQPGMVTPEQLESLSMPVLALVAGKSVMHDDQADEVAARHLRQGTVRLYPEASHALNGEVPEQIAKDMTDFLADIR
ncbi:alpha/beta hydrolase [Luteococcus sp. H138]|uniref:alpha/beta fold hydrolase n=1 Tax=unclassified Luteococcus TaxID=2639923 RepID=UPI00313ACD2F